jgi:peptide/nickel transport system permease protein
VIPFLPLPSCWPRPRAARCQHRVVIGDTTWPATALLIRSQTLSIKERPYLERARVLGAGRPQQIVRPRAAQRDPMVIRQHHASPWPPRS